MIHVLIIITYLLVCVLLGVLVACARYYILLRRANKLITQLLEQNEELNKVLAGARVANEILADALEDEPVEEQWPNLIG